MEIVTINGSSILARGIVKFFAQQGGTKLIQNFDMNADRTQIKEMEREIKVWNPTVEVINKQIKEASEIKEGVTDAACVLFFQDDYLRPQSDKLQFFKQAALISQDQDADRFLAVFPIEYDTHCGQSDKPGWMEKLEVQDELIKSYKEGLTVFNSNLTYGDQSLLFNYIGQSVKTGQVAKLLLDSTFKFHPLHNKDTGIEVMCEGEQWGAKSKKYSLSGFEEITCKDLVAKFEKFYGVSAGSTKPVDIALSPTEVSFE